VFPNGSLKNSKGLVHVYILHNVQQVNIEISKQSSLEDLPIQLWFPLTFVYYIWMSLLDFTQR